MMARVSSAVLTWQNGFSIEFSSVIRRHYVYKDDWTPFLGEIFICYKDNTEEARKYDDKMCANMTCYNTLLTMHL